MMDDTLKQHGDLNDQSKRYAFMNTDNQMHTSHSAAPTLSSCPNSGGYTDTLTYKKSVSVVVLSRLINNN